MMHNLKQKSVEKKKTDHPNLLKYKNHPQEKKSHLNKKRKKKKQNKALSWPQEIKRKKKRKEKKRRSNVQERKRKKIKKEHKEKKKKKKTPNEAHEHLQMSIFVIYLSNFPPSRFLHILGKKLFGRFGEKTPEPHDIFLSPSFNQTPSIFFFSSSIKSTLPNTP